MAVGGIKPNVAAESGMWRMKGLMTRDGTAEHVSTDQILRREQGREQENIFSLFS